MGLFFADLVREASWGTGAGDLPLEGALPGHRRFADTVPPGARFHYCIAGISRPEEWETGEGELGSGGTLVRMPAASSEGGGLVAFAPGLKTVALTVAAQWFAERDPPPAIADVTGLAAALAGKAETGHDHMLADVAGLEPALAGKAEAGHGHAIEEVAGLPGALTALAPADHGHEIEEVEGLQAALDGKQPADAELSALAGLASAADRLPYFTGAGSAALATFSGFGRSLVDDADAAAARTTLGLGSAAVRNTGTSGDAVPLLNGAATSWSAGASFGGNVGAGTAAGSNSLRVAGAIDFSGSTFNGAGTGIWQPAAGSLGLVSGGSTICTINASGVNLASGRDYHINSTRVVTSRRTGWAAPTGTATRSTFATGSVTLAQLAERVKALIDDLTSHGLIGS